MKQKTKPEEEMFDIEKVAKLANLELSDEEKKKFAIQFTEILHYIERLRALNTEGVEPTSQVTGLENVLREDEPAPSLAQEDVLKNTKSKHNGFFKVKAILNN